MAQKNATMKARSMDKNEVMLLLSYINQHNAITSKATNATNNKLKEEAWKAISHAFSAHLGETRRPEQLRLKWENLKKAARKRSAAIRQNHLKTGGGKSYIGPDEVLDHVASMLGATCNGFTVEFGGDREDPEPRTIAEAQVVVPDEANILVIGEENRRQKLTDELRKAEIEKELMMAAYFKAKTQKIELENIKLKCEIDKLQNKD